MSSLLLFLNHLFLIQVTILIVADKANQYLGCSVCKKSSSNNNNDNNEDDDDDDNKLPNQLGVVVEGEQQLDY